MTESDSEYNDTGTDGSETESYDDASADYDLINEDWDMSEFDSNTDAAFTEDDLINEDWDMSEFDTDTQTDFLDNNLISDDPGISQDLTDAAQSVEDDTSEENLLSEDWDISPDLSDSEPIAEIENPDDILFGDIPVLSQDTLTDVQETEDDLPAEIDNPDDILFGDIPVLSQDTLTDVQETEDDLPLERSDYETSIAEPDLTDNNAQTENTLIESERNENTVSEIVPPEASETSDISLYEEGSDNPPSESDESKPEWNEENGMAFSDDDNDGEDPDNSEGGKVYPFDRDEWWQRGMNAIDRNMEAIHDDYIDKGYVEGEELDSLLARDRAEMVKEFTTNFNGDLSYHSDYNNSSTTDYSEETEDSLAEAQDELQDSSIPDDELSDDPDASASVEDQSEYYNDSKDIDQETENSINLLSDDAAETDSLDAEYDTDLPDQEDRNDLQDLTDDVPSGDTEIFQPEDEDLSEPESTEYSGESSKDTENDSLSDEQNDQPDTDIETDEQLEESSPDNEMEDISLPPEIDEEYIYNSQDEYDLDGIDIRENSEQIDQALTEFGDDRWAEMDLEEQKASIGHLAESLQDILGLTDPPEIQYYHKKDSSDYGGYTHSNNTLMINEYNIHDNDETVDTLAHELWHAYQYQCADAPRPGVAGCIDWQRQYGLDQAHYIDPQLDDSGHCINFDEYREQLVEAEARAFASQVRDHFRGLNGGAHHG